MLCGQGGSTRRPGGNPPAAPAAPAILLILLLIPAVSPAAHESALKLHLTSKSGHRHLTAGGENLFLLEVSNTRDQAITDIRLSARVPENWQLSFTPEHIPSLAPGKIAEVRIAITPPRRAAESHYALWIRARSEAADETLSVSLRVEDPPGRWLIVATVLTVALLGVFAVVFIRVSRAG